MNRRTTTEPTKSLFRNPLIAEAAGRALSVPSLVPEPSVLPEEFITLFHTVETLRLSDHSFILQFVAPRPGAGTTTIATGFARAAAQAYQRPVLFIDAGSHQSTADRTDPAATDIAWLSYLAWSAPAPSGAQNALALTAAGNIPDRLTALRRQYHAVIIDCPALSASPEAVTIARHCDGAALVAAAIRSSPRDMIAARDTITRVGGQVLGAVFNRERSYRPRWLGAKA